MAFLLVCTCHITCNSGPWFAHLPLMLLWWRKNSPKVQCLACTSDQGLSGHGHTIGNNSVSNLQEMKRPQSGVHQWPLCPTHKGGPTVKRQLQGHAQRGALAEGLSSIRCRDHSSTLALPCALSMNCVYGPSSQSLQGRHHWLRVSSFLLLGSSLMSNSQICLQTSWGFGTARDTGEQH